MEKEKKQESSLLFEDNQWQHRSKIAVWNEVCFLVTNPPKKLMLHVYHDPLGSILQPSGKEEFAKFINGAMKLSGRDKLPRFKPISLPTGMGCQFQLSTHLLNWLYWKC